MSVRILVRDRNDRPVPKAKVFVKWKSGSSTVYVDDMGSADIDTTGYVVYTDVYGDRCKHELRVRDGDVLIHKTRN